MVSSSHYYYYNVEDGDNNITDHNYDEDDHYRIYGKRAIDVEYGEECMFCNSRIDEFGLCACGAGGS